GIRIGKRKRKPNRLGLDKGYDSEPQRPAVRFAIVAFVQAQAVGFALALADANAIDGLQQLDKVIAVGFTQGEVEWVAIGVDDPMAFQPFNPVFSGVPDLGVRPFLDLTTLAS